MSLLFILRWVGGKLDEHSLIMARTEHASIHNEKAGQRMSIRWLWRVGTEGAFPYGEVELMELDLTIFNLTCSV